jgi:TolB protein
MKQFWMRVTLFVFGLLLVLSTGMVMIVRRGPAPSGWITYISHRSGSWFDIYRMHPDGAGKQILINGIAQIEPVLSPDGEWFAYAAPSLANEPFDRQMDIYRMRTDGSDVQRLTDHYSTDNGPVWSPDGEWIAFWTMRDGNIEVYRMRADGSNETRLTTEPSSWDQPSTWSPDGKWVVFSSDRGTRIDIYKVRADGSEVQRLTGEQSTTNGNAVWSPDGKWIAFNSDRDGRANLYRMRPDGSDVQRLTNGPGTLNPTWSADSQWIAFMSNRDGDPYSDIYRMRADGSDVQRLTDHAGYDLFPSWSAPVDEPFRPVIPLLLGVICITLAVWPGVLRRVPVVGSWFCRGGFPNPPGLVFKSIHVETAFGRGIYQASSCFSFRFAFSILFTISPLTGCWNTCASSKSGTVPNSVLMVSASL